MSGEDQSAAAARWREQGFTAHQVAELAAAQGWKPGETMKALKKHFGVRIGEGKQLIDRLRVESTHHADRYLRFQTELVSRILPDTSEAALESLNATGWNVKLWALVQADRDDDINAAIARFDPESMTFPALTLEQARDLVNAEIADWRPEIALVNDFTTTHEFGWTFTCHYAEFVRTRDMSDTVIGLGPFFVDRFTGVLWGTGSALSLDVYIENYRATGNPMPN